MLASAFLFKTRKHHHQVIHSYKVNRVTKTNDYLPDLFNVSVERYSMVPVIVCVTDDILVTSPQK